MKSLAAGTEIRIQLAESGAIRGRTNGVTETALIVNTGTGSQTIDRGQVRRVAIRTRARRKRSMLVGLAIGAGAGVALGGAAAAECEKGICGGHGTALVAGTTAAAGIVGVLVGAAVSHGGWQDIYWKPLESGQGLIGGGGEPVFAAAR